MDEWFGLISSTQKSLALTGRKTYISASNLFCAMRTRFNREIHWRSKHGMQFILGVVLFVVVLGAVDAGVPWPRCRAKGAKQ